MKNKPLVQEIIYTKKGGKLATDHFAMNPILKSKQEVKRHLETINAKFNPGYSAIFN